MVISDEEKAERTRRSELWWASHAEGEKAAEALKAAGALTPLFIPLKREYFEAFKSGEKTQEYRPLGARWNDRTCAIGRPVVLSLGYGKGQRLAGVITGFRTHPNPPMLPGWSACYGTKHSTAAIIKISFPSMKPHNDLPCPICSDLQVSGTFKPTPTDKPEKPYRVQHTEGGTTFNHGDFDSLEMARAGACGTNAVILMREGYQPEGGPEA